MDIVLLPIKPVNPIFKSDILGVNTFVDMNILMVSLVFVIKSDYAV